MMNIYFVDEHNSSKGNGIGTFRNQLLPSLGRDKHIRLTLISLNSDISDLCRRKTDYGVEFQLPPVGHGNWRENGGLIWPVLRTYINDSSRNIFIVNHSPCAKFISALKELFPLSKVVFVIHDQGWTMPLLGNADLLRQIIADNKVPASITHNEAKSIESYVRQELEIYNLADRVVCLSPSTHKILKEIYKVDPSKIQCIPNGYAPDIKTSELKSTIRRKLGLGAHEKILVFAGRPAKAKGIEAGLMAIDLIKERFPQLRCVFCGKMDGFAKFSERIKPIASKLTFTGQLTKSELYDWYLAADIGLLPSYTEQCSYSAIEMVISGLPVIATDGNGLRDMFVDGKNGFVASIGDALNLEEFSKNIADKLSEALCCSAKKIKRIVNDARHEFSLKYSPEKMTDGYLQLFSGLR